jgi:hypothetical protein
MADDSDEPAKDPGAWGQAVAAVLLIGALGVGLWAFGQASSSNSRPSPATCSGGEAEKVSGESGTAPRRVSGAQLCRALNRADLDELLGTPGEIAKSAGGSDSSVTLAKGTEIATPSARVELGTYTVNLSATYDRLPVSRSAALRGEGAQQRTILGHPAVFYSDRTIRINFRLDGSDSSSGPGVPARCLVVAQDAKDRGGSLEITLWRADGVVPDDVALLRVAEKVLPTIPGWAARG